MANAVLTVYNLSKSYVIYPVFSDVSFTVNAGERVEVPCGFLLESPGDLEDPRSFLDVARIGAPPRERAERAFNVQRWTVVESGGHFPALEVPELFVEEVRAFFRPLRSTA